MYTCSDISDVSSIRHAMQPGEEVVFPDSAAGGQMVLAISGPCVSAKESTKRTRARARSPGLQPPGVCVAGCGLGGTTVK